MNYHYHYQKLIDRAPKDKPKEGYWEHHHIIPKCMGGNNKKSNLVYLTAEEHYVAHQLLVKMYPDDKGLQYSAHNMGTTKGRKCYAWLRKLHSNNMVGNKLMLGRKHTEKTKQNYKLSRTGSGNGMFNKNHNLQTKQVISKFRKSTYWINNGVNEKAILKSENIPEGWYKGRLSWKNITNGIISKQISITSDIPIGWEIGRTIKTK